MLSKLFILLATFFTLVLVRDGGLSKIHYIFYFLALAFLWFYCLRKRIRVSRMNSVVALLVVLILVGTLQSAMRGDVSSLIKFIGTVYCLLLLHMWAAVFTNESGRRDVFAAVKVFVFALGCGLVAELVAHFVFSYNFDLHETMFPWSGNSIFATYGVYRASSFLMEPGALSNVSLICAGVIYANRGTLNVWILGCFALALSSFSFAGGAITGLFLLAVGAHVLASGNLKSAIIFAAFGSVLVVGFLSSPWASYINTRLSGNGVSFTDNSTDIKKTTIETMWSRPTEDLLIGSPFEATSSDGSYINSLGVFIYSVYFLGIFGWIFAASLAGIAFSNLRILPLFAVFMLQRYSFAFPQFSFALAAIVGLSGEVPQSVRRLSIHGVSES